MLAYGFIVLAVAFRLLPHPFSFTPVGAALLFFGAQEPRRRTWIPVALLAASDVYLTLFHYQYPLGWDQLVTWGWYLGIVLLGSGLRNRVSALRVLGSALLTAVSFFLVSNFAVWAASGMYPKTASGLATSYVMGLPFFRTEVVSDVLFAGLMFGIPVVAAAVQQGWSRRRAVV